MVRVIRLVRLFKFFKKKSEIDKKKQEKEIEKDFKKRASTFLPHSIETEKSGSESPGTFHFPILNCSEHLATITS